MDRCGLTVGGFYKHFESKEDLFRAAMTEALAEMRKRFSRMDPNVRGEAWRRAVANYYLTEAHRDNRGTGCAFAALCGDLQRADDETRAWFQEGLGEIIGMFADRMEGATDEERRAQAWQFFASLLGGLIMSRSVADPKLSSDILAAVRTGETAQS
jgi:TetR/AcrR family transcriptional repressor of nem operon